MDHQAFVHVADADPLPQLRDDRLRGGKPLAVHGVPVRAVVEDQVHVAATRGKIGRLDGFN